MWDLLSYFSVAIHAPRTDKGKKGGRDTRDSRLGLCPSALRQGAPPHLRAVRTPPRTGTPPTVTQRAAPGGGADTSRDVRLPPGDAAIIPVPRWFTMARHRKTRDVTAAVRGLGGRGGRSDTAAGITALRKNINSHPTPTEVQSSSSYPYKGRFPPPPINPPATASCTATFSDTILNLSMH